MSTGIARIFTPKHHQQLQEQQLPSPLQKLKNIKKISSPSTNSFRSRTSTKNSLKASPPHRDQQDNDLHQHFIEQDNRNIKIRISPSSNSSSLTSEIPSFGLDSYNDIVSSTSSTNVGLQSSNLSHQRLQKSYSVCSQQQFYPSELEQNTGNNLSRQCYQFQKQPCLEMQQFEENPCFKQGLHMDSPNQMINQLRTSNSSSVNCLLNQSILPFEIQKAIQTHKGMFDEIQMNYDEVIPFIEMPVDRRYAMQKVVEAQRLQESLVMEVLNNPQGTSLSTAIENIIQQFNKTTKQPNNHGRTLFSPSASIIKQMRTPPTQSKKISKKISSAPLIKKTQSVEAFQLSATRNTSIQGGNGLGQGSLYGPENSYGNQPAFQNNQFTYLNDRRDQGKDGENRTHFPQVAIDFGENQQANYAHGVDVTFASVKTGILSPRKNVLQLAERFEDEANSQIDMPMNQFDDFSCQQPKLKKHMSDPYGDYYFNHLNYNNSHPNPFSHAPNNFINQATDIEQQFEAENLFDAQDHNIHQDLFNFKKDEEDTLYGPFHSKNDTFEDLLNSQNNKHQSSKQLQNINSNSLSHQLCKSLSSNFDNAECRSTFRTQIPQVEDLFSSQPLIENLHKSCNNEQPTTTELIDNTQRCYNEGNICSSFNKIC